MGSVDTEVGVEDTDTVDDIAAVTAADAIHPEIQVTWLVEHKDQSAV